MIPFRAVRHWAQSKYRAYRKKNTTRIILMMALWVAFC
jgi:hypothetical protein